jgi:hypothetical protein
MRIALLAVTTLASLGLAGCFVDSSSDDGYYYDDSDSGFGSGWGGGSGVPPTTYGCQSDAECPGMVCARTRECLSASLVHAVHTTWTLDGAAASTTSCSAVPKLAITFSSSAGEQWGYAPVPCNAGKFTIDKFPTRFGNVQLARESDYSGGAYGTFDTTGNATLDLPY